MRVPAKADAERAKLRRGITLANQGAVKARVLRVECLAQRMCKLCPEDDRKPAYYRLTLGFNVACGARTFTRRVLVCDEHRQNPF